MIKLYIAGPMTGYEDFNYPAFLTMEEQLQYYGYRVINPARLGDQSKDWQWNMKQCIRAIPDADGVVFLNGWEKSRGASLEYHIALHLKLPKFFQKDGDMISQIQAKFPVYAQSVFVFPNGMVAVCDQQGKQIPFLQGVWTEMKEEIKKYIDDHTERHGWA